MFFWSLPTILFAQSDDLSRVISALSYNLQDGSGPARAVLTVDGEFDDPVLSIYTADANNIYHLAARMKAPVWPGNLFEVPYLKLSEHGSLQVWSSNFGIGRNKWEHNATIVYRDGAFLMAGFTNTYFDTLEPANSGSCDVNFLGKKMEFSIGESGQKKLVKIKTGAKPIGEWTQADLPPECNM